MGNAKQTEETQRKEQLPIAQIGGEDYGRLLTEIRERVRSAQYEALRAVNKELVTLYWDIGRIIIERQTGVVWGNAVVERLAGDLRVAFPGIGGFSASNLWRMKAFYEAYASSLKLAPLVREIGWSHNLLILERCADPLEREFYIRMTRKFGWSKNVLIHQIENQAFEKTMLGQTNFEKALTPELRAQAKFAVKDEYTFDFLEMGEEHAERELERALVSRVEDFLRAMGGMFAFVGSQFRLEVENKEYKIDLLLFHRRLKCLVALELKIGEFEPEFVGKMQFYLAALDEKVRHEGENPSIGIILCKEKRRTVVEYALRNSRKPIGVATYRIFKRLPRELRSQLPSPEQIAALLEGA